MTKDQFNIQKSKNERIILTQFKRVHIILFNIYSWYWLYKLCFIEQLPFIEGWESYYWWFLVTSSQLFFYKTNKKEVLFK